MQLSMPDANTFDGVITAVFNAFKVTVKGWQTTAGGVWSCTKTCAVQVAVLPLASCTVRVAVLLPILAQVNNAGDTATGVTVVQLSEEVASSAAGVTVALPEALSATEVFWQATTGGKTSVTATVAAQVAVLPCESAAVRVTVLLPTLAQVNNAGCTDTRV